MRITSMVLLGLMATSIWPAYADSQDIDHIGFFGLTTVVFKLGKVSPQKYKLEAHTANGADVNELIASYQRRAEKLCGIHKPIVSYKITKEVYIGDFSLQGGLPMTAPVVVGFVTCK